MNPNSWIQNLGFSGVRHQGSDIRGPESGVQRTKSRAGIRNPGSGIRGQESGVRIRGVWSPGSAILNPEPGIQGSESGVRNLDSVVRILNLEPGAWSPEDPGLHCTNTTLFYFWTSGFLRSKWLEPMASSNRAVRKLKPRYNTNERKTITTIQSDIIHVLVTAKE